MYYSLVRVDKANAGLDISVVGSYFLLALHWSAFGQINHSSGTVPEGKVSKLPLKWAHFAGESNTMGYSVAFMLIIFMFCVIMSSFDMQCGQA